MGVVADELGLVHFDGSGFAGLIDSWLDRFPEPSILAARNALPPVGREFELYPYPVFDLPLSGEKVITFCDIRSRICTMTLHPGDVFLLPPGVWKLPRWTIPHEMSSLVFQEKFVRITYVELEHSAPEGGRPVCSCFFHTADSPTGEMRALLRVLCTPGLNEKAGGAVFRGLLHLVRELIAREPPLRLSKSEATFIKIRNYLIDNCMSAIGREDVARRFELNCAYLSRLFHRFEGCTLSEFMTRLRLDRAAMLLRDTVLSVDEIADRCCYRSTPFFTNQFKRYYGLPPARYRSSLRAEEYAQQFSSTGGDRPDRSAVPFSERAPGR